LQTHYVSENLEAPSFELGTSRSVARNSYNLITEEVAQENILTLIVIGDEGDSKCILSDASVV
jgi:hypothetical protein